MEIISSRQWLLILQNRLYAGRTVLNNEKVLNARLQDFQAKFEKMKTESAEQINKIRNETAKALEKMSSAVKNDKEVSQTGTEKSTNQMTN